jgi:hypothetical protein
VDALNKNTSAGAPMNCSKRAFMEMQPDGKWKLLPVMLDAIDNINAAYARQERASPIFMAHLKDQAIPEKKVIAEKVRVFSGGPMAWTIAVRQRLLWFIRMAQGNRRLFELGAGTVAQSIEWDHLYKYLTHFGEDRIVAGDFGKFDKKMGSTFILYAFWIIVQFANEAGMEDEDINEIWCVAEDTAFAFTNFNGDLLMFLGSNPSGHPLTVIVNSLVNSLYMRYAFFYKKENRIHKFKDYVNLYTYGDDNIMGVSKECTWFNHTIIADVMATIGVEYTMPDKESESRPFMTIEEASFLKRSFRYHPECGAIVAPLEWKSVESSLLVGIVRKDMAPEAHAVSVCSSALNEAFWHGKEKFQKTKQDIMTALQKADLLDWINPPLPTWESCLRSYKRSSKRYLDVAGDYTP